MRGAGGRSEPPNRRFRTVNECDNHLLRLGTMNQHPLHPDVAAAPSSTRFDRKVVAGYDLDQRGGEPPGRLLMVEVPG